MDIINKADEMHHVVAKARTRGLTIGFIPTMGALHPGHLSLMEKSVKAGNYTIVSIYVNPAQFNDKTDFVRYPRSLKKDVELISTIKCDVVFAPDDAEIYPKPDNRIFDFGYLDKIMEGKYRPGHFNGVAKVVSRLFDIVKPDIAYFGEKDFQQLAIIREMVKKLNYQVNITGCPIFREPDGLAMSSRNMLLTPEMRRFSPAIYQALKKAEEFVFLKPVDECKKIVISEIEKNTRLKTEYFEIVDNDSLEPLTQWNYKKPARGCVAVHAGEIRLIDNFLYHFNKS